MTDIQKVKIQEWWMEQLRVITRKTMAEEEKRHTRARVKADKMLGSFSIERREDIDDLYGYGAITEKKRDKLYDLYDQIEKPDVMYEAKIELLRDAYQDAKDTLADLGVTL